MSDPNQELLQSFASEAEDVLARMQQGLLWLESSPTDLEAINNVFRAVHTLKGNAMVCDFEELAELAHVVEDHLARLRDRKLSPTPAVIGILLRSVDALRELVSMETTPHAGALNGSVAFSPAANTLRVDVARLDEMLSAIGELSIERSRLVRVLEELGTVATPALDLLHDSSLVNADLQRLVLEARLVPIGTAFAHLVRVVRDLATTQEKEVELVVEGGNVKVDTRIVNELRDPLTHLVRNALDHGIETPELRTKAGKRAQASLKLVAHHSFGSVQIDLSDDGAGIDRSALLARAREKGLVAADGMPGDASIDRLIFEPGVSTARTVTALSGRGVGMDIVRRHVEALGGTVHVASERGRGTTFSLRVPLTIAITTGLAVSIAGTIYVVPLAAILECLEPLSLREGDSVEETILWRGRALPCLRLRRLFGNAPCPQRELVVVVAYENHRAGLIVDHVLGDCEVVLRPLGRLFRGVPGIAGSTTWGDGSVALILDVPSLLRQRTSAESLWNEGVQEC